jgi:hypothetical protein
MNRVISFVALAIVAAILVYLVGPSWAQTVAAAPATDTVVVPYGAWLQQVLGLARDTALVAVPIILGWASRSLPGYAAFWLKTKIAEQWLARAIIGAHNSVSGAVQGKTLSVDVGNAVLAHAVQDMLDNAPAWLINFLGGVDGIKRAILRRLDLESKAVAFIDATTGAAKIETATK